MLAFVGRSMLQRSTYIQVRNISAYLQVLTPHTLDTRPCLLLHIDSARYLINAPSGLHRFLSSHRISTMNLKSIFCTSVDWNNSIGGVPGVVLAMNDVEVRKRVCVFGPRGSSGVWKATQKLINPRFIDVRVSDCLNDRECYRDEYVKVTCMPTSTGTVNYLIKIRSSPPKFDDEKASFLGVSRGPIRAKLVAGETITLDNGNVVQHQDVCSPPMPAKVILITHTENAKDISATKLSLELIPDIVTHIIGNDIWNDFKYNKWRTSFPTTTQHLLMESQPGAGEIIYKESARQLDVLFKNHRDLFLRQVCKISATSEQSEPTVHDGKTLMSVQLMPDIKFPTKSSNIKDIDLDTNKESDYRQPSEPTIKFLGTASRVPSKLRNVSSILLHCTPKSTLLMDAGDGTLGQLYRLHGQVAGDEIMSNLSCLWISHFHADHTLGLPSIVSRAVELSKTGEKLLCIGPRIVGEFLKEYSEASGDFSFNDDLQYVDAADLLTSTKPLSQETLKRLGLSSIQTIRVDHCVDAFAVCLSTSDSYTSTINNLHRPFQIIYSGDTRPCPNLHKQVLKLSPEAHHRVLVHESTYDDTMHQMASDRRHSTTSGAIKIAGKMRADVLLMTHFSQRYPSVPKSFKDSLPSDCIVGAAYDGLQLNLCRPNLLNKVT